MALSLRAYQRRIVDDVAGRNAVVLLPTGAGKTAIAAEVLRRRLQRGAAAPGGGRFLFLVPTQLLVEQQAAEVRAWCAGLTDVAEFHGGETFPERALQDGSARVLVSTPKAFSIQQARRLGLLGWDRFGLVVFDEVHHVLKDHPYRKIALTIPSRPGPGDGDSADVQVLGLTASLTYAVQEAKIQAAIAQLTREMRIEKIATASEAELSVAGYHANRAVPEVLGGLGTLGSGPGDEVVDLPEQARPSRIQGLLHPPADRKPHVLLQTFWQRWRARTSTPFALALIEHVFAVESSISTFDASFASPLEGSPHKGVAKIPSKMADWGEGAKKRRVAANAGAHKFAYWALEQWYEALRILVASWEENQECAVMFLRMMFSEAGASQVVCGSSAPDSRLLLGLEFLPPHDTPDVYVRLESLKRVLLSKVDHHNDFRGIVFVQQRVTTHILAYFLRQDKATAARFRCAPLYATSTPATPSLVVSKADSKETLRAFAAGTTNLLISTVVAEEGMDVPAANCVVRYDPVLNAVSHVQGRGRARQADSSFVVLSERADRPVESLQRVEARQQDIAASFAPPAGDDGAARARELAAQRSRESVARDVLDAVEAAAGAPQHAEALSKALATLNLYCKKTKVQLEEAPHKDGGVWRCLLKYHSCLRTVCGSGSDASAQKVAKKHAAWDLLVKLKAGEGFYA